MSDPPPAEKRESAWQPFTPQGVAAFARASFARLFVAQFVCALACIAAVIWFFQWAWLPTIANAARHLPPDAEIRGGRLVWHGDSPQLLAEGSFLALAVDLKNEGQARSPAHVDVVFGQSAARIFSLFGFLRAEYPQGWRVAFNRVELEAWWGAWKPAISVIGITLLLMAFLLAWAGLATLYFLPAWLVACFANRALDVAGAWRLAGAALLPGALFLAAALVFYGLGAVDPIRLVLAAVVHVVLGWVYLLTGILASPPHVEILSIKENPFATQPR